MNRSLTWLCITALFITGGAAADTPLPDPALARAQAAAGEFRDALRQTLSAAVAEGGPVAAVGVCHDDAPRLAAQAAAAHGVRLGRVGVAGRERNPAHVAEGWQADALARITAAVAGGAPAAQQVVVMREGLPDGVALRMARGIETEPACLACHGSQIGPEVAAVLAEHYPRDRATGFVVGDLRGLLWVEVPAAITPNPTE
jgi:hypothetical protein